MNKKISSIFGYNKAPILGQKNIIIYGCFESARAFAMRLLNQDILFHMFLFPDASGKYSLPTLFHKPVIDIAQCLELSDCAILVSYAERETARERLREFGLDEKIFEIEQLSGALENTENIVLYGMGKRAENFYKEFLFFFNKIRYICDSDPKKSGMHWHQREVVCPSYFERAPENTAVIIASTYVDEIRNVLGGYGIAGQNIFVYHANTSNLIIDTGGSQRLVIGEMAAAAILRDLNGKQSVLYGEAGIVQAVQDKFSMLGITFDAILPRSAKQEDGSIFNLCYQNQDHMFVLADHFDDQQYRKLKDMGIKENNIVWLEEHDSRRKLNHILYLDGYAGAGYGNRETEFDVVLDPNIGHAYISDKDQYSGFVRFEYLGPQREEPLKIVILGGSTSMVYGTKIPSWCEYFSEILMKNEISHAIYCGGIDGYTASHEFIKLVRDAVWINPDIIISYSGTNNMQLPPKNPFIGYYQQELFESLANKANIKVFGQMRGVNYGVGPNTSAFGFFYRQLSMMQAVCEKLDIRFQAFFQPVLPGKTKYFPDDGDVAILDSWLFDQIQGKYVTFGREDNYWNNLQEFIHCAEKISEPWFCNLSGLFDGVGGVYMDRCHVYKEGNQMIAKRIYEELTDCLENREG